jgi:hypothetical protein
VMMTQPIVTHHQEKLVLIKPHYVYQTRWWRQLAAWVKVMNKAVVGDTGMITLASLTREGIQNRSRPGGCFYAIASLSGASSS